MKKLSIKENVIKPCIIGIVVVILGIALLVYYRYIAEVCKRSQLRGIGAYSRGGSIFERRVDTKTCQNKTRRSSRNVGKKRDGDVCILR